MFDSIFDAIEEWMRDLLTGMVTSNLTTMFTDVNEKTGEIATQVGMTPQGWNSSIYNMVQSLSNSVIVPIAGIIITMVLCYELISIADGTEQPARCGYLDVFQVFLQNVGRGVFWSAIPGQSRCSL